MLKHKVYICQICETSPDQISHHKNHLESQKHRDKKEIFSLRLSKMTEKELLEEYQSSDIEEIIKERETFYYYEKKLNNNVNEYNDINAMTEIVSADQGISNREALRDKIHEIHNYLRNNGVGYGMNALKVFNIFYALKKIEENNLHEKINLDPRIKFSNLLEKARKNKNSEVTGLILNDVLDAINASEIREILFYEIPKSIKDNVCAHLIQEIEKISRIEKTCNVLLSGKVYEYFIGRDETAISELGAYFTDRHIVNYIYSKLDANINENCEIESMIDMFGGSGGFTTGYIDYLNRRYPGKINWANEMKKIFHYDINEDVIKSAGLEFFCMTGVLPKIGDNLAVKNAFTDEFSNKKFKNVITNPPYGGDKLKQSDIQVKRNKVKDYIKSEIAKITDKIKLKKRQEQLKQIESDEKQEKIIGDKSKVSVSSCSNRIKIFADEYNLTGNDKESCSLMLMMDLLDVNGTAIGVLKEGVFFNKTYTDLRKCLIQNFNVKEIVSVPQDQFENTSTKTSIVIFQNSEEKTSEVIFKELIIERYENDEFAENENDEIVLIQNKGDIKSVSDKLISTATKDEILKNLTCSLNGKDYNKKEIICGKDYELVKLETLCEVSESCVIDKENYNYVEISDINNNEITGFLNLAKNDLPTNAKNIANYSDILISTVRPKKSKMILIERNIKNIENYIFSSALVNIRLKDKKISHFIFAILYSMVNNFEKELCNGSSYPRFKPSKIFEILIPLPKLESNIQKWINKLSVPYDEMNLKKSRVKELESFVQNRIREISENEDCDDVELESISDINMGATPDTSNDSYWNNGDIPWVTVSELNNCLICSTNKCITKKGAEKISNRLITKGSILLSFKLSIGKLGIAGVDMYCNEAIVFLNSKLQHISQLYLYYLLSTVNLEKYGR